MTITDLNALSATLTTATANVVGVTEQARLRGFTADAEGQELVAAIHHRKAVAAADAAYTAAVVAAVGGSGSWGDVQQAGIVAKQVKAGRA